MSFLEYLFTCAVATVLICICGVGCAVIILPIAAVVECGASLAWLLFCPVGVLVALFSGCLAWSLIKDELL